MDNELISLQNFASSISKNFIIREWYNEDKRKTVKQYALSDGTMSISPKLDYTSLNNFMNGMKVWDKLCQNIMKPVKNKVVVFDIGFINTYRIVSMSQFVRWHDFDIWGLFPEGDNFDHILSGETRCAFVVVDFAGILYLVHDENVSNNLLLDSLKNGRITTPSELSINIFDDNRCFYDIYYFNSNNII